MALNLKTHLYSGRKEKLGSLVAAKCSALFNNFMKREIDAAIRDKVFDYAQNVIDRVDGADAIFEMDNF